MEIQDAKNINGAASQYDRWLRALDPDYAQVDGRSFSELLNFAVQFGKLINFYDIENNPDGDWELFFLTDTAMIVASQQATNLSELQHEFTRLEQSTLQAESFESKFNSLRQTFALVLKLARQIDLQLRVLELRSSGETQRLLRQAIVTEIESSLSSQLRRLKAYDLGAGEGGALGRVIGLNYEGFSSVWRLPGNCADATIYRGRTANRKVAHALPELGSIFSSCLYAVSDLRQLSLAQMPAALKEGNHSPQLALYIAFARLLQTAQETINTFSSRYARFYYRDILRESDAAAIPDRVYLTFALDESKNLPDTTVPANTLFPAGKDTDGGDLVYASDRDLVVSNAAIATLQTLRVIQGKLTPDDPDPSAAAVVQRILSSEITPDPAAAAENSWATFGERQIGKTETEVTQPATLGFALASSYLWLTGGTRTVTVGLAYSSESWAKFIELLAKLSAATSVPVETIFASILREAFTLYVSMSAGWFRIEQYTVLPAALATVDDALIELRFELPPNIPPLVAYDPASGAAANDGSAKVVVAAAADPTVYVSNPAPSLPTLKSYLRQDPVSLGTLEVYPLSLLAELELTGFRISTSVSNLTGLQLANTDGEIDTSVPFPLFGGVPVAGSYLLISHEELFAKTIDGLQLYLNWFNLPSNNDGFQGYYRDYVIGPNGQFQSNLFNNGVFHGGLSIQNPGKWFLSGSSVCPEVPAEDVDVLLFRTQPDCNDTRPADPLCPFTAFDTLTVCRSAPPLYYDAATSAIKLELTSPAYAFGNDLYAANVLNAVLENLPDTNFCRERSLAECAVLAAAAECIETGLQYLAACSETMNDMRGQCVRTCVSICLECLRVHSIESVTQALENSKGLPVEDLLRRIQARLQTRPAIADGSLEESAKASVTLLAEWLDSFRQEIPAGVAAGIERSSAILNAILSVLAAADTCKEQGEGQEQCLTDLLTKCKKQLDQAYANDLAKRMDECLGLKRPLKYPSDPYLPQLVSLTVSYSAHCASPSTESDEGCGLFFNLSPFGSYDQLAPSPTPLLPRFTSPGNLYLGFSGLVTPQTLTLLFQTAVNTGEDVSAQLPPVAWEYLSGNCWHSFPTSSILADSTNGLQNSGIVALDFPAVDLSNNTVLAAGNQWLRASVTASADEFPCTIGIYPHAVLATWSDNDNTGAHLVQPLPANTIKTSVPPLPAIAAIQQPMPSFGGRPAETGTVAFDIRVGERLRHKERAILGWDYERLVLERFPTVWKTQTLPARDLEGGDVPGHVLVVIVVGPDSVGVADPTVPAATGEMLGQIQAYLEGLISPFIQVKVVNPRYVRIEVRATVQFAAANDAGASLKQLNNELVQYLSPWFYDAARAARGGQYISEADISEFIQTRPYVDALVSLEPLKYEPPRVTLDWYFLTSAQQHKLSVAQPGDAGAPAGTS